MVYEQHRPDGVTIRLQARFSPRLPLSSLHPSVGLFTTICFWPHVRGKGLAETTRRWMANHLSH